MDSIEVTLVVIWMDSALVRFLEVVADVKEFGIVEIVAEVTIFAVGCSEAGEPVVSDVDTWFDLVDAAIF